MHHTPASSAREGTSLCRETPSSSTTTTSPRANRESEREIATVVGEGDLSFSRSLTQLSMPVTH